MPRTPYRDGHRTDMVVPDRFVLPRAHRPTSRSHLASGGMFKALEALHELFPWWGTIAAATLLARLLMTPMVVYSQSKSAG